MFLCDNGPCLLLSKRCNNRDDCGDNSDEQGCPSGEYNCYSIYVTWHRKINHFDIFVKVVFILFSGTKYVLQLIIQSCSGLSHRIGKL